MKELQELLSAIGRKRAIILFILLAINLGLAGMWQKVLLPQQEQLTADVSRAQSDRSKLQTEMRELPIKHAELEKNEERYDELKASGLFLVQDRIDARTRMDALRVSSGLRGVDYKIEPQSIIDTPAIAPTNNQLVMSPIHVDLSGLSDHEVYRFMHQIMERFNGLIVLKDIKLEKKNEVNPDNLRGLKAGDTMDFVTATVSYEWYGISPKSSDKSSPLSKAFEGSAK